MVQRELHGRAPLRISFAGGGTDLESVFLKHGGTVINATIAQHTNMTIKQRDDSKIFVNTVPLENADVLTQNIISKILPPTGLDITYTNDVPPRRGLGSSSTYSVLLTRMINELCGRSINDTDVVEQAYNIESDLGICGWQDQYAVAFGGFNYMQFSKEQRLVFPLRIKYSTIRELESSLLLSFTGGSHDSYAIKNVYDDRSVGELKSLANMVRDALLHDDVPAIGHLLHTAWEVKQRTLSNNNIFNDIYRYWQGQGVTGGKLLGAGDGGYFLFFVPPNIRYKVEEQMRAKGSVAVPIYFTDKGVETWTPKKENNI